MKYEINDIEYQVIIEKKNNKNTYIRLKKNNVILVTTNYFVREKQILNLIDQNVEYIEKMRYKIDSKLEKDDKFYYLGKNYDIIIINNIEKIEFLEDKIYIPSYDKLNKYVEKQMKLIYKQELEKCYNLFEEKIPYPNLKIRKMKTRWGVCNRSNNNVTLNSELIRYELIYLDYVIVHELSHFVHFDHSKDFWKTVSKYCPNYKIIRKKLKE